MAGITYTPIQSITASGSSTSITFSSIPQTYTNLVLITSVTTTTDGESVYVQFNGDSGSNYSRTNLSSATDPGVTSTRQTSQSSIAVQYGTGIGSNQPSISNIEIPNYTNTTTYKTVLSKSSIFRGSSTNKAEVYLGVGLWRGSTGSATQAITSITVGSSGTFNNTSTFTLYGVLAA